MRTSVPLLRAVKPSTVKLSRVESLRVKPGEVVPVEPVFGGVLVDDPTVYPDYEPMSRDPTESNIAEELEPVIRRYQAQRRIVCHVGSDTFIYWSKGDNTACVSPDIYVLPGIPQGTHPRDFADSNGDGCWKTWVHGVPPEFALEVKAWKNPRKDELQSPERHEALGTKELIVFDPFVSKRRSLRKRFALYRQNAADALVFVLETNDDRVYSQQLGAFLVAEGDGDDALLRLAVGPNGAKLLPFESELVNIQARRIAELEAELAQLRAGKEKRRTRLL